MWYEAAKNGRDLSLNNFHAYLITVYPGALTRETKLILDSYVPPRSHDDSLEIEFDNMCATDERASGIRRHARPMLRGSKGQSGEKGNRCLL
jgi:hypothetical protein